MWTADQCAYSRDYMLETGLINRMFDTSFIIRSQIARGTTKNLDEWGITKKALCASILGMSQNTIYAHRFADKDNAPPE